MPTINANPYNVLSSGQAEEVQSGVLDVLTRTGVVFHHPEALEIFQAHGCEVVKEKHLVRIPAAVALKAIESCPSTFELKGRDPSSRLTIGGDQVCFSTAPGKNHLDLDTFDIRPPSQDEWAQAWRVIDFLDGVDFAGYAYGSLEGHDTPYGFPYSAAITAKSTAKAGAGRIGGPAGSHIFSMRIFAAAGITPLASPGASPPLTWYADPIQMALDYVRAGYPIKPVGGLAAGANAPATLAGALIQNLAEVLSLAILIQLDTPGAGVLLQDYSQMLDMRTGMVIQGGIERGLMGAAFCQVLRAWDIPRMTLMQSDAKRPDYQCASEKIMSATLHALAGSNVVPFMGTVYNELIFSPVLALVDNDVARMAARLIGGVNISDETKALDLIHQVGPIPGQFLDAKHTRDFWAGEQTLPHIADRRPWAEWFAAGAPDIIAQARIRCQEIMETHQPVPLEQDQEREIDEILKEAHAHFAQLGMA